MAIFFYTAKSLDGETKTGTRGAKDIRELAQNLRGEGLILIKADSEIKKDKGDLSIPFLSQKVSLTEKMLMTRNLSVMVSTGLSLVKGFSILAAQSKSKKMKSALLDMSEEIGAGKSLSECFKKYPDIFSELFLGMIIAGEESGTLDEVLRVLSLQLEKEKEMNSKIQRALIYPCILVATMLVAGIVLTIFVFPKLQQFFSGLNAQLPITTRIILGSGNFIVQYWYFIVVAAVVLLLAFLAFIKTKQGKFIIDTAALKIKFVSILVKKSNAASLIRSLSSLLSAGVPLIKSLEITAGTVKNFYFKRALNDAAEGIKRGEKLFNSLAPHKDIFPYGVIEIIEVGEETGKTPLILKKLAEFYEDEVSDAAEGLTAVIEPVLIVFMGAVVGIFAVSVIGPLYSSLSNIK